MLYGFLALVAALGSGWALQNWGQATVLPHNMLLGLAAMGVINASVATLSRLAALWGKERAQGTIVHLLLTPMSARQIISGRLAASISYHWLVLMPLHLLTAFAFISLWERGFWMIGPMLLSVVPLVVSTALWAFSFHATRSPLRALLGDWRTNGLKIPQTMSLLSTLFLGILGLFTPPAPIWAVAGLLFLINAVLARAWFLLRVRQLEALRRGQILWETP